MTKAHQPKARRKPPAGYIPVERAGRYLVRVDDAKTREIARFFVRQFAGAWAPLRPGAKSKTNDPDNFAPIAPQGEAPEPTGQVVTWVMRLRCVPGNRPGEIWVKSSDLHLLRQDFFRWAKDYVPQRVARPRGKPPGTIQRDDTVAVEQAIAMLRSGKAASALQAATTVCEIGGAAQFDPHVAFDSHVKRIHKKLKALGH